jgi:hypothetical protein
MTGERIPTQVLYSVVEAMTLLSLSRTTIYEEFRAGRLESVHLDRIRLVPAVAIADYVALLRREAAVLGKAA